MKMQPILAAAFAVALCFDAAAQNKTIKMQSTWPASNTLQEHFKMFGEPWTS
jgi:TRAP-type C4-dicarboxylate transport system substrate-binding protein